MALRLLPFISSMAYVPLNEAGDLPTLRDRLTVKVLSSESVIEDSYDEVITRVGHEPVGERYQFVRCYDETKAGYIGVPRTFGLSHFSHLQFIDRMSYGVRQPLPFTENPLSPRSDLQRDFWQELANVCSEGRRTDLLANASTGSGKTAGVLWLAGEEWLKAGEAIPTLIIVHTNKLKWQWLGNLVKKHGIKFFFGEDFVEKYVCVIQQDQCDYKGKLFGIALLPSLARRDYGPDFYRYWGIVDGDEIHKFPTPAASSVLAKFPAARRFGQTATNREDALQKVITLHLGKPRVKSKQKTIETKAFIYRFKLSATLNDSSEFTMLDSLVRLPPRQEILTDIILTRGWQRSRNVLVLSDRIKQLVDLKRRLVALGVPAAEIGMHVGELVTGNYKAIVRKDGKKLTTLTGSHKKTLTATCYDWLTVNGFQQELRADPEKFTIRMSEEKLKVSNTELDRITDKCKIIFATYGIFDTGTDVARIDMGIEASPRGNVKQPVGRIQRPLPGKAMPEWIGVEDIITSPSMVRREGEWLPAEPYAKFISMSEARVRSYKFQGCTIKRVN